MKRSGGKKGKLTLKQAKLVQELPKSNSMAEAGAKAGYACRQSAHEAFKAVIERSPDVLQRLGLTHDYVLDKCLRPLLEAKETKFFQKDGIVMQERDVEANDIRIRAIELWGKLMGAFTAQKVQLSGDLNLELNHASDDELDREIDNLLRSPKPPAKA
jgi:hypothetical protein